VTWFHERVPTSPVTTMLRRLLAIAVLASALVWVVPASASAACACTAAANAADTEQAARNARDVFTGTVVSSTAKMRDDGSRGVVYTHEVTVELVYKGDLREEAVQVRTLSGADCDLGRLTDAKRYVFFVEVDEDMLVAEGCGGTQRRRTALVTELEALYGEGDPPSVEQPAEPAEILPVPGVQDPTTFTRAAAPGGAMVLVGLLGLVVVRRLARR
jgi:hypothetical protein